MALKKHSTELRKEATEEAHKNYQKLNKPRTCNLSTYVNYWAKETAFREKIQKTTKKVKPSDSFGKAVIAYFSILPPEGIQKMHQKILQTFPYSKRRKVWREFTPLIKELEKSFVQLAIARNKFARDEGYQSYQKLILARNQIPPSAYKHFAEEIDKNIKFIHKQLPQLTDLPDWFYSSLNLPCFLCQISFPGWEKPDEVIDFVEKKYPILKRFRNKISIQFREKTQVTYQKETDTFKIELEKDANERHQAIGLIHELSHVIVILRNFGRGKNPLEIGKYKSEKLASEIEFKLLKTLSPEAFLGRLGDILLVFHRVLFELALYSNPRQNLPRLYAKIFNRCFPGASQQTNQLYLLDQRIVSRPLSFLPQAIAYSEILSRERHAYKRS